MKSFTTLAMTKNFWNIFGSSNANNQPKKWEWKETNTWLKKKKIASLIEGMIIPKTIDNTPPIIDNMETSMPNAYTSQEIIKDTQITMWMLMMRVPIHKTPVWFQWVDWCINLCETLIDENIITLHYADWRINAYIILSWPVWEMFTISKMFVSMNPEAIEWVVTFLSDVENSQVKINGDLYKQIMSYLREIIFWPGRDYRIEIPCQY